MNELDSIAIRAADYVLALGAGRMSIREQILRARAVQIENNPPGPGMPRGEMV